MGTSLLGNRNPKPHPTVLISHRVPWVKTPPGPGLLMSALARAVHSRVRRAPGSSGGCSPWGWPQPCDTVPAQWLQLPQRREERRPARKDQQRPLPWPLGNSPGKTLGNITWAKFPTSVFFFKKNIAYSPSTFSVCRDNQQVLRADFPAECVRVCVCP